MHTFLHKALGPNGTSDFCKRVLEGIIGHTDKIDIKFIETYNLLQQIHRPDTSADQWIIDRIDEILTLGKEETE